MEDSSLEPDCGGEERTQGSSWSHGGDPKAVQEGDPAPGLGRASQKTAVNEGIPWEGERPHLQAGATHDEEQDLAVDQRSPQADSTDRSRSVTYHEADVLDLPDAHVNALPLVDGQADVEQVVLVSHAADLHEGQEVTVIVTALRLQGLEKWHRMLWSALDGLPPWEGSAKR